MTGHLPFGAAEVAALLDRSIDLGTGAGLGTGRSDLAGQRPFASVLAGMAGLRLPAGAAVIIAMSNGRLLLELYFAALLTGATPMPISPATPAPRIARLAAEIGAGAVLATRLRHERFPGAAAARVGPAVAAILPAPVVREPGTALMLTSGTSGMFGACLHRAGSLARNAELHAAAVGLRASDTVLVTLPLYYSYAIVAQAYAALGTGARLVISGPPFSPAGYRAAICAHGVTVSSVTPTIARLLVAQGGRLPTGLRVLTVGGDRLAPAQVAALLAANPALELYLTYGLAEAGPRVSTLAAHAEPAARHGSVGLPLPGVRTALRPASGHRDAGELLVTSDTVLIDKLGSTDPVHGRPLVGPDMIATGDLFSIDGGGYLHFAGRLSDFIVVRGEKVSLYAVRQLVQSLPGVVRCGTVVGTDRAGETHYDLQIRVGHDVDHEEPDQAGERIHRSVLSWLLPGERPRRLTVDRADNWTDDPANLAAFIK